MRVAVHRNSLWKIALPPNAGWIRAASVLAETQINERKLRSEAEKSSNRSRSASENLDTMYQDRLIAHITGEKNNQQSASGKSELRTTRAATRGSRRDDVTNTRTGRYRTPQTRRECGETVQNAACARKKAAPQFVVSDSSWKDGKLTVSTFNRLIYLALGRKQ